MVFDDPAFWRAGAISTITVMSIVLIMLTIDSLAAISPGGSHVPPYTVINQHIDYKFDSNRGFERAGDRHSRTAVRQAAGRYRRRSADRPGEDGNSKPCLH